MLRQAEIEIRHPSISTISQASSSMAASSALSSSTTTKVSISPRKSIENSRKNILNTTTKASSSSIETLFSIILSSTVTTKNCYNSTSQWRSVFVLTIVALLLLHVAPCCSVSILASSTSSSNPLLTSSSDAISSSRESVLSELNLESLLSSESLDDAILRLSQAWHLQHAPSSTSTSISTPTSNPTPTTASKISNTSPPTSTQVPTTTTTSSDSSRHRRSIPGATEESSTPNSVNVDKSEPLGKNCTKCSNRVKEKAKAFRIEAIKQGILSKLGFDRPPNVSVRALPRIPPITRIIEQFHLSSPQLSSDSSSLSDTHSAGTDAEGERKINSYRKRHISPDYFGPLSLDHESIADEYFASTEKTIVFARNAPQDRTVEREHRAQWFDFPSNLKQSHVERATLWLYVNGTDEYSNDSQDDSVQGSIVIYKIVRSQPSLMTTTNRTVPSQVLRNGGWIQIQIPILARDWLEDDAENLGLSIHSWDSLGSTLHVIHSDEASKASEFRPFIEIRVSSSRESKRSKRMAPLTCDDKSNEVHCCRFPLTIDFVEFGWEWIIAPKRYEANYCSGDCALYALSGAYPHTHLVRQTEAKNETSRPQTGACCSPRKMAPISMLYLDDNMNIIYGILPNMVVEQCDCS